MKKEICLFWKYFLFVVSQRCLKSNPERYLVIASNSERLLSIIYLLYVNAQQRTVSNLRNICFFSLVRTLQQSPVTSEKNLVRSDSLPAPSPAPWSLEVYVVFLDKRQLMTKSCPRDFEQTLLFAVILPVPIQSAGQLFCYLCKFLAWYIVM